MAYQPTAEDFEDESPSKSSYMPSSEDFEEEQPRGLFSDTQKSFTGFPEYATNLIKSLPHEINEAIHMPLGRSLKNIGAGTLGLGNLPHYTAKLLSSYGVPGAETIASHSKIPVNEIFGLGKQQAGDSLFQLIGPGGLLGKATKGMLGLKGLGARSGGAGLIAGSQGENPLQAAMFGGLTEGSLKGANAAKSLPQKIAAIPTNLENAKNMTSDIIQKYKQPYDQLKEHVGNSDKINRALEGKKTNFDDYEQNQIRPFLNNELKEINNLTQETQNATSQAFPELPKSQLWENINNQFKNYEQEISSEFEKRYGDYSKEEGNKNISNPIDSQFFLDEIKNAPNLKPATLKAGQKITEYKENIPTSSNDVIEISLPPKNGTVDDYISAMREFRDARMALHDKLSKATEEESKPIKQSIDSLTRLQEEVEKRIEGSVSSDSWDKFKKIQNDYREYKVPLKAETVFRNPTYKGKVLEDPFKTLMMPAYAKLRERLLNNPEFRSNYVQYKTQGNSNPSLNPNVKLNEDITRHFSPQQKYAIDLQRALEQRTHDFENLRKNIKSPEKALPVEQEQLKNYSPEAEEFINRILHEKSITKQMEKEAKNLGLSIEELKSTIASRRKLLDLLKNAGGIKSLKGILRLMGKL